MMGKWCDTHWALFGTVALSEYYAGRGRKRIGVPVGIRYPAKVQPYIVMIAVDFSKQRLGETVPGVLTGRSLGN